MEKLLEDISFDAPDMPGIYAHDRMKLMCKSM